MKYRAIHVERDRDLLLEFHCRINYESETPHARKASCEQCREKWLSTSQPESYLQHLIKTMNDKRTLAEILEDNGKTVGYLWVAFTDIEGYDTTIAEVMDCAVAPGYQRQGIGTRIMTHIERMAKKKGASLLRSDTGIENKASQKLHEKAGFKPHRICYEKIL